MTTPGDDSRTELAWREIVENYGERAVLADDDHLDSSSRTSSDAPRDSVPDSSADISAASRGHRSADPVEGPREQPLEDPVDDTPEPVEEVAGVDRFRPPPAPPFPRPRTWQRGVAWSGIFVAPLLAVLIGLTSIYVTPLLGWTLVVWFVGGFLYLVREMPRSPRDPWDDGSRV